jgi:hypothetical protein
MPIDTGLPADAQRVALLGVLRADLRFWGAGAALLLHIPVDLPQLAPGP